MILAAAGMVFSEQGVRGAIVEDILRGASVSRRTFYRLFGSKEEVALELYRIGTERLLEQCRIGIAEERGFLRKIERCIDAHLLNARELGRMVYVLGGEAQRPESLLHPRRVEVHDALVELAREASGGRDIDPLVFRALILTIEGIVRLVLEEGDEGRAVEQAAWERAKATMLRIATGTLSGRGANVTPLPKVAAASVRQ